MVPSEVLIVTSWHVSNVSTIAGYHGPSENITSYGSKVGILAGSHSSHGKVPIEVLVSHNGLVLSKILTATGWHVSNVSTIDGYHGPSENITSFGSKVGMLAGSHCSNAMVPMEVLVSLNGLVTSKILTGTGWHDSNVSTTAGYHGPSEVITSFGSKVPSNGSYNFSCHGS